MRYTLQIILMISSLLLFSCGHHQHQEIHFKNQDSSVQKKAPKPVKAKVLPKDSFRTGVVLPDIKFRRDTGQSFALFLPKNYTRSKRFPVIIFFDPHGRGSLPLTFYHKLAEKNDYILIGSNDSRNGLSLVVSNQIAVRLLHEVTARFPVYDQQITVCGFSGGAKVAMMLASEQKSIANIIYCGAAIQFKPNHPIAMLGFAGQRDMNYTDVAMFDWSLKDRNIKQHYLIQWKGKHEWPSVDVFENAFTFLNTGKVENYAQKQVTVTTQQVQKEQRIKQQFLQAFRSKDLSWWRQEINSLNQKKDNDLMYNRLLGFISLACYSYASQALNEKDLNTAKKVIAIYGMADPENEDYQNMKADLKQMEAQRK